MTTPPLYRRKLSAIERYNLVINSIFRYNVDGIVEGEGELDLEQWRRAVAIAAAANPGVRVRLKSFLGFCKWVDSGIPPSVEVVNAPEWDGYSERGTEFMQDRFQPKAGGPICDIKLLPGSPARIVFRGLHAAMDARGLTWFGNDIFRILRGEEPLGSPDTITDLDIRLQHQDSVNHQEPEKMQCIPVMPPRPRDDHSINYIWRRVRIPAKMSNALPKMIVFLAEQARQHTSGDVAFTVPVDFRGLRQEARSTGNLTGYLRIVVEPGAKPKEVMRAINQQIRDHVDCYNPDYIKVLPWIPIGVLESLLAKKAHRLIYTTNDELPTGGVVSLGHFEQDTYSFPGFRARSAFGIPGSVGKLNVVLHNYSDATEVVFTTADGYNTEGQLDALIDAFRSTFGS